MSKKDTIIDIKENEPTDIKEKPPTVLNYMEAQYLLMKLDTPSIIPINGHKDRVSMNTICNTLIQIVKESKN